MKKQFATSLVAGAMALAGMSFGTAAEAATLQAWWSFNNTTNVGTNLFMFNETENAFGDGVYDSANGRLYPVHNTAADGELITPGAGGGFLSPAFIDVSNLVGTNGGAENDNWGSYAGTGLNRPSGTFAGGSLSIVGSANNGRSITLVFGDLYTDLDLSVAARGTGTGFSSRAFEYLDADDNWVAYSTPLSTGTLGSSFLAFGISPAAGVEAQAIRITFDGATSTNGNNRLDNLQFNGTLVPEPASLALLGLGSLVLIGRRKG
ncbi:MAG: PEP-CTERM sorting domain-containing protein [Phycisphaeraceae bacterium]|nr:PEP-CTERM sorting domain-containing protein [Phycisphaeraceae bacterium]